MRWSDEFDDENADFIGYLKLTERRAIKAYKSIQKKDPVNELLKFANISKRFFIFDKIEIDPRYHKEFLDKYQDKRSLGEREKFIIPMDNYASDLEKVTNDLVEF